MKKLLLNEYIKKDKRRRIDAFELWCWRRLLRVPCTARRFNQSILEEISPEYSLEGLMLKLKLQDFGHMMQTTDSFVKTPMLGMIEGRRRRGQHRMSWLDGNQHAIQFSRSVMSDSLWPHGLQHARLPYPSSSPWACTNSCPLSRWCHPTISSSVTPYSSSPQYFPAWGPF